MAVQSSFAQNLQSTNNDDLYSRPLVSTPTVNKLDAKQANIASKLQAKTKASGVGVLDNIYDADTYTMRGNKNSTRALGIDAYETTKDAKWLNNPYNAARMDKQRSRLSLELGREVTNEDVFAAGEAQNAQAQSILGKGTNHEGLPAIVQSYEETNPNPSDKSPQNNYGRNLGAIQTLGGMTTLADGTEVDSRQSIGNLNTGDTIDIEALQALAKTSGESKLGNLVDAAQFGLGRKLAGVGDALGDTASRTLQDLFKVAPQDLHKHSIFFGKDSFDPKTGDFIALDKYKLAKEYGYDDTGSKQALKEIGNAKGVVNTLGAIASNVDQAPELFLESVGELFMGVLKAPGLLANAFDYANQNMEDTIKAQKGNKLNNGQRAVSLLVGLGQSAVNKLGADEMIGRTNIVKTLVNESLPKAGKSVATDMVKTLVKNSLVVAGKAGYEGLEEVIQESMGILGTKYNINAEDIFDDKTIKQLKQAFGGGVLGGGVPAAGKGAVDVINQPISNHQLKKVTKKVKEEADKKVSTLEKDAEFNPDAVEGQEFTTPVEDLGTDGVSENSVATETETVETNNVTTEPTDVFKDTVDKNIETLSDEDKLAKVEASMRKKFKEAGRTDEEIEEVVTQLKDTIKRAGISLEDIGITTKNLEDKKQELSIEPVDEGRITNRGSKKSFKFKSEDISDSILQKASEGILKPKDITSVSKSKDSKLSSALVKALELGNAGNIGIKALKDIVDKNKGSNALLALSNGQSDDNGLRGLRAASILVKTLSSSSQSERDIQKDKGTDYNKVDYARNSNISVQLGKEYVNSYGIQIAGSPKQVAKAYAKIGNKILDYGTEIGIMKTEDKAVPLITSVDSEGNTLHSDESLKKSGVKVIRRGGKGNKVPIVQEKVSSLTLPENIKVDAVYGATNLGKLLLPTTEKLPSKVPEEDVISDEPISEAHKDMLVEYQKLPYKIKESHMQLFFELKDLLVNKYGGDRNTFLKDPLVTQFLQTKDSHSWLNKTTEEGRNLNRSDNLMKILDNLDSVTGQFHYSYESAINQRIHILETVAELQGDKYMSRPAVTGSTQTTNSKSAKVLLESVASELGVTEEELLAPTGKLKKVVNTILENEGKVSASGLINIYHPLLNQVSPFKTLSLVSVLYDIHKAKDKNKITTDYMVEFDMSASGVINTLFNLSGNPEVQKVLKYLMNKGTDPYQYLDKVMEDKNLDVFKQAKPIIKKLKNIGIDRRDLSKYLIMTWFYGSHDTNVANNMAHDLAVDIVRKGIYNSNTQAIDFINSILGEDKYDVDTTTKATGINNLTKTDFDKVVSYLNKSIATMYTEQLPTAFPGVTEYRLTMKKIFKILKNSGEWDGKVGTAMDALEGTPSTHKMSVMKTKAELVKGEADDYIFVNNKFFNENSLGVNFQHASDAAQIIHTVSQAAERDLDKGVASVHDAIYIHANQALGAKADYEKLIKEVAEKYDYIDTALDTALTSVNLMEDSSVKDSLLDDINDLRTINDKTYKAKKTFLSSISTTNFFGSKKYSAESKPTPTKNSRKNTITFVDNLKTTLSNIDKGDDKATILADFIKTLKVPSTHKDLQTKVIEAIEKDVEVLSDDFTNGKPRWEAGYHELYVDTTSTIDPRTGKEFTQNTLLEVVAHEIDHAIQYQYITENSNSAEVKYLAKVVKQLEKKDAINFSTEVWKRISYITNPTGDGKASEALKISELMSVLRNEPDVLNELNMDNKKGIIANISKLIQKAYAWMKGKSAEELDKEVESFDETIFDNTIKAMELLDDRARAYTSSSPSANKEGRASITDSSSNKQKQYDTFKDAAKNPYKYAQAMLAKQNSYLSTGVIVLGSLFYDLAKPTVRKGHVNLKKYSSVYRDTVNLIRTGFADSDMLQRLNDTIGVTSDVNEKLMNDLLTISDDITQQTAKYLTEDLKTLDDKVHKLYPEKKDRVELHHLFTRTAIADLQLNPTLMEGLIKNDMTIEEALKIARKGVNEEDRNKAKELAKYYNTGVAVNGVTNTYKAELFSNEAKVLVALEALNMTNKGLFETMDKDLKNELFLLAVSIKSLSDEINVQQEGFDGKYHDENPHFNVGFDGHYSMDVYNNMYKYKLLSSAEFKSSKYTKDDDWVVVREPSEGVMGVVAQPVIDASSTPGVGLNSNVFNNGFYLESEDATRVRSKLNSLSPKKKVEFLNNNQLIEDSGSFRLIVDNKTKADKLELKEDVAHTMWRTFAHNKELVEMQTVRDLVTEKATVKMSAKDLDKLNFDIIQNVKHKGDNELPMFIQLDFNYESYDKLPKWVKNRYKTPERLTTYNGFRNNITLVKRAQADVLLGHKNFSMFGDTDYRTLARVEQLLKRIIVMAKQHMVVASAEKLSVDLVSNFGLLTAKDVSLSEIYRYGKEAFSAYTDFSKKRTEILDLELRARFGEKGAENRLESAKKKLENHKFYDAFKAGFVQSYSTSLVVKDFDSLSGLQSDIDNLVESITKDKNGNPNDIYNVIKWWQKFGSKKGLAVDSLFRMLSKRSSIEGTTMSEELKNLADRLKQTKDSDSVDRYIGNIIGGPSSEMVKVGGAVMITGDVISKYILAKSLRHRTNPTTDNKYTKDEAYMEANNTFIDYRRNLPKEVKALSDYSILLFPAFWIKAQKVILGLLKHHPITAAGGYIAADILDMNNANFIDTNIINKVSDGHILNNPTSIIDWDILFPWL